MAAVLKACPKTVACSLTALELHGVDLPGRLGNHAEVHVLAPAPGAHPVRRGVKVRWSKNIASVPRKDVADLACCDPVTAWIQAADTATDVELAVIGDGLIRRSRPLARLADLTQAVARSRGRRHVRKLRRALALIRPNTDSPRETWLRLTSRKAGLPEPEVNWRLVTPEGVFVALLDLYWPALALAAEYDGDCHDSPEQRIKDNLRRRRIEEQGVKLVVATKADFDDPWSLVATLRRAAGLPGSVPPGGFVPVRPGRR
jgi:hypothetical protein